MTSVDVAIIVINIVILLFFILLLAEVVRIHVVVLFIV